MIDPFMGTSISPLSLVVVGIYLLATLLIGYLFRRSAGASAQFLHARHTLPTAITAISFLAANCGALEIIGIVAASAKYGLLALHFYWIGAIPAMIFLALFMMPIYAQSRVHTVPEFLRLRYDKKTQILNIVSLAVIMGFISGISLYAIASVLQVLVGWSFFHIVLTAAVIVWFYVSLGGLKATIYNEVLQLAVTIAGLVPLVYMVLRQFHGIDGILRALPAAMTHVWKGLPIASAGGATMDIVGVVFGLGFVLSFGYWCTDFVLIQRALAAKSEEGSIATPLIAAFVKLFFPLLLVVPGLVVAGHLGKEVSDSFDYALPALMLHYYGPALLGLGISAIVASLMAALASNINALSTIWTHDLYKTYIQPHRQDGHYVLVGRLSTVGATLFSIATAWIALRYNSLMDYLQLLFSLFNAPLFAIFLLGMFTTWATPDAAFWGLLCGMIAAMVHNLAYHFHWLSYGSLMLGDFYGACIGWSTCLVLTIVLSRFTQAKPLEALQGITHQTRTGARRKVSPATWGLVLLLAGICVALNILFW
jgi:SSS family solute:Na+ symporter